MLKDASQFRPGPPYSLTSRKYAADVNEVQRLGGDDITTPSARTDEQTEIALYWVDTSPLMWNRITRAVSSAEGLDLWESARVFGLLNLALTDGYIGTWETKYHYRFWRPVTAIRLAGIDGNAATNADPTWTPLLETPSRTTTSGTPSSRGAGPDALLPHQHDELLGLQPHAARGTEVRRRLTDSASLHELLPGGR